MIGASCSIIWLRDAVRASTSTAGSCTSLSQNWTSDTSFDQTHSHGLVSSKSWNACVAMTRSFSSLPIIRNLSDNSGLARTSAWCISAQHWRP
eukprot:3844800-Pyramimonas_sp.AAC.1